MPNNHELSSERENKKVHSDNSILNKSSLDFLFSKEHQQYNMWEHYSGLHIHDNDSNYIW
jgi:hypothetical protein